MSGRIFIINFAMGAMCDPSEGTPDIKFYARFTANLPILFQKYTRIITFLRNTGFFASSTGELISAISEYLQDPVGYDTSKETLLAIDSTHKLHPLDYGSSVVTPQWLLSACLRQHKFGAQFPMQLLNFENCYRQYVEFLYLCYLKPNDVIVPNKMADFMWHAHMLDNDGYKKDMMVMLRRVLNHVDDFSEADLRKYQEKTKAYQSIFLKRQYGNSSSSSSRNFSGFNYIYYGGGVCGGTSHDHHNHHHHHDHHHHHNHHNDHHNNHHPQNNDPHHTDHHHHSGGHDHWGGGESNCAGAGGHHHDAGGSNCGGGASNCGGNDGGGGSSCGGGCGGGGGD